MPRPLCPLIVSLALVVGCADGIEVDPAQVRRDRIEESFREPSRTRLPRTWTVAMPVDGRIGIVDVRPGDRVTAGQHLAAVDTKPFELAVAQARAELDRLQARMVLLEYDALEQTALEELEQLIRSMAEVIKAAQAQVEAQQARYEVADRQLERAEEAAETAAIAEEERDRREMLSKTTLLDVRTRELVVTALEAFDSALRLGPRGIRDWLGRKQLQQVELQAAIASAESGLERAAHELSLATVESPIDGVVLERLHDGDGPVAKGTPLVSVGDLAELEIVADVLTEDALRLAPGSVVLLESVSLPEPIEGRVDRIDPAGFTKLSSLGIEQQRVHVVVALDPVPEQLGVGYRLQARFITGSSDGALVVPRASVLQSADGDLQVFAIHGSRVERRVVQLGLGSDLEFEVLSGVEEGAEIVAAPDVTLADGDRVTVVRR